MYVSTDGGPERLFASGNGGTAAARWICPDSTYMFHLYAGTSHQNPVAELTVTSTRPDRSGTAASPPDCPRDAPQPNAQQTPPLTLQQASQDTPEEALQDASQGTPEDMVQDEPQNASEDAPQDAP